LSHKNKQNSRTIANWRGCQKGPDGDISAGQLPHFPAGQLPEWGRGHSTSYGPQISKEEATQEKIRIPKYC